MVVDGGDVSQQIQQGVLIGIGAFDGDQMIGYSVSVLVRNHLHYSGLCYLQNDVVFVTAKRRHGSVGMKLIKATEEAARENGAKLVMWHAKAGSALHAVLPRLGYRIQDILFSKQV
jgi:predicted GNAT superfamily acetyltransferase